MSGTWEPWEDSEAAGDDGDDHVDFAALDFSAPDEQEPDADLFGESTGVPESEDLSPPSFTVTNPPGTVAVTAAIDGSVQHVDLAPSVAKMTERELAEEIRVIADLARMKALSVVHAFLVEGVRGCGQDASAMSASLTRGLGVPTPEQAAEATARVFADRYGSDADWHS
ncbi:hypothetical protein AWC26_18530 [Mycobacterium shimoidei]|nr:hypothetical protein [Mycobacterium shimoidei]ODR12200.1 hypothetical protein BHQ16_16760 [Mycobacterium shimoidei]ORW78022.1 hypothetical protein AWC26_18530 [Mycobacterium shimoidei]